MYILNVCQKHILLIFSRGLVYVKEIIECKSIRGATVERFESQRKSVNFAHTPLYVTMCNKTCSALLICYRNCSWTVFYGLAP